MAGAKGERLVTALYTTFALLAFASNSVLCRMALGTARADPSSFTAIRLLAGAITLWLVSRAARPRPAPLRQAGALRLQDRQHLVPASDAPRFLAWLSPLMLFTYAAAFSFAYVTLSTGTGALILFGSVQATMLLVAVAAGERPHALQWAGLAVALAGLVYLVLPGLSAPTPLGSALMAAAGIAWGVYTLRGRGTQDALTSTKSNFVRAVPFAALLALATLGSLRTAGAGALLAVLSGALASGLGYVGWYAALRGLTATRAASVQLMVPLLAAGGGVALLDEPVTLRLTSAALMILGGVGLAVFGRQHRARGTARG